jgi:predicted O-linked N-acetylglucosamine transferase (SPINDLY family)
MGTRRLRVGFVSRFIFNAAVGLYMDELIPQLDANKYETVVFAVGQRRSMKKRDALPQIADHVRAFSMGLWRGWRR